LLQNKPLMSYTAGLSTSLLSLDELTLFISLTVSPPIVFRLASRNAVTQFFFENTNFDDLKILKKVNIAFCWY